MLPFHGYVIVGYYTSWSIYSRNYPVWQIDPHSITHLNYAFANLNGQGEVILGDRWADVDKVNTGHGDSWSDPPGSLHGNFHQLWRLKEQNRALKVGLSVGGWTWSGQFSRVASTEAGRERFAMSAVQLMVDLGLDYLDLDWEYPGGGGLPENTVSPDDAANMVKLLGAIRAEYSRHNLTNAQLTAAISCNLTHYDLSGMAQHLDYFLLMGYDFAGGWSTIADHQANLYARDTGHLSVDNAIKQLKQHANPRQIVIGVPFYGRSFAQTAGLAQPFSGVGPGSWESGILDYKAIPPVGCKPRWEPVTNATFCYNPTDHLLVTYDDPTSLAFKLQYLRSHGLGGVMFWDLSGDLPLSHPHSLLRIINAWIGGPWKDTNLNNLCYPHSKYPNINCNTKDQGNSKDQDNSKDQGDSKEESASQATASQSHEQFTMAVTSCGTAINTTPHATTSQLVTCEAQATIFTTDTTAHLATASTTTAHYATASTTTAHYATSVQTSTAQTVLYTSAHQTTPQVIIATTTSVY